MPRTIFFGDLLGHYRLNHSKISAQSSWSRLLSELFPAFGQRTRQFMHTYGDSNLILRHYAVIDTLFIIWYILFAEASNCSRTKWCCTRTHQISLWKTEQYLKTTLCNLCGLDVEPVMHLHELLRNPTSPWLAIRLVIHHFIYPLIATSSIEHIQD